MAIAPLTITAEREKHVDFSKPFMDLGLLLYMAKRTGSDDTILFLQPFSPDLWLSFLVAYIVISLATTLFTSVKLILSPTSTHRNANAQRLRIFCWICLVDTSVRSTGEAAAFRTNPREKILASPCTSSGLWRVCGTAW